VNRLLLVAACAVAAALIVRVVRDVARRRALLDVPTDRSSHDAPKPRLGGLGIVLPVLGTGLGMVALGRAPASLLVILGATAAVAMAGLADDLRPLPTRTRLRVQFVAEGVVVLASWGRLPAAFGPVGSAVPVAVLAAVAFLGLVWGANFYNFMDGIDGLAGSQAVIAGLALAFVAARIGAGQAEWVLLAVAGSSLGFLLFNFPPASIFMGDVGSTGVGFLLASLPLFPEARPVTFPVVVLALSLFVLDATVTLVRRVARGEGWSTPHRTHLYQRPVVAGAAHGAVLSWAIAGMTLVALCAMAWPGASGPSRSVLWAIPVALLLTGRAAFTRMERRAKN
jgi:UDP-N-acetylmuramyl pentapeptide phosphotransferase/UDP-N-acetylglucosamine-1-phosphate transferase